MEILRISQHPELLPRAAAWFHGKWGIPLSAYEESMQAALQAAAPYRSGISPGRGRPS